MSERCASCEKYLACRASLGHYTRATRKANVVINEFPDCNVEVLVYPKAFEVLEEQANVPEFDRSRKWNKVEICDSDNLIGDDDRRQPRYSDVLVPKKDWISLTNFQRTLDKSNNRSLDNFYGYALSNVWEYFITLTFSPECVNRHDDDAVKCLWSKWLDNVKQTSPDIMTLMVPERHKDGAIHFHGFASNLNCTLSPAVYPADHKQAGQYIYSKCGEPVFNMLDWQYGFSTCCVLPTDTNQRKVVNYCVKYMKKDSNIGYNKKRYYHTTNLAFKTKYCAMVESEQCGGLDLIEYYRLMGLDVVKADGKGVTVLRGQIKGLERP